MTYAQNTDNFISKYFAEYEADSNFDRINVDKTTFEKFSDIEAKSADEKSVLGAISKLDGIKVLFHEKNTELIETLRLEAKENMDNDGRFEELMTVDGQEGTFFFMVRENEEDVVQELTVLIGAKDKFLLATLFGELELQNVPRLANVIRQNGKEWFKIFENIDSEELVFRSGADVAAEQRDEAADKDRAADNVSINVFPNPVSDYVQLEASEATGKQYTLEFFSMIGERIKNEGQVNLPYKVQLENLPSGAYFLRLTDADGAFKNFRIVKP